jgi:hypothetical protein
MEEEIVKATCPTCSVPEWVEGTLCPTCYGAGALPLRGISAHVAQLAEEISTIKSKVTHIKQKVDDIWDKVK